MLTLKNWMECFNYRISEGSDYQWNCYGNNAYRLDGWIEKKDSDGKSTSAIFNTIDQTVYQVEVHDLDNDRSYRYINPDFRDAYRNECKEKGIEDNAYDHVKFIDLETEEDLIDKCRAIMNFEDYDDRVSVPIELDDTELLVLMKMAHDRDMTFNQFVEEALRYTLAEFEQDPEGMKARVKEFANG